MNENRILAAISELGDRMEKRFTVIEGEVGELKSRLTRIEAAQMVTNGRLDEMGKRMDDQMRVITALIPARIAAVPPAAE